LAMPSSNVSALKRVVFLDVDGVLHPALGKEEFSVGCMEQLKRLVEETGADIVLSSSRRVLRRGASSRRYSRPFAPVFPALPA